MTASNSKGVNVWVVKTSAVGTPAVPTGATKAKPSVIASTAAKAGWANAAIAVLAADSTALPELDGKTFPVGAVTAGTDFALVGSDTTNSTVTFSAGGSITVYAGADLEKLCLSTLTFNTETPGSIDTPTFCDPTASVPSATYSAGTIEIGGYIDITDPSYNEIIALDAGGRSVTFGIQLPNNGWIIFSGVVSGLSYDIPLDGALAWSASVTLAGKPRHLF